MPKKIISILSIAGSDPCGGAGIQADIRTGAAVGVHVLTAITSVTVQNSHGLLEIGAVSPDLLKKQLDAILMDCLPDAIKVGMVGSIENGYIISDFLKKVYEDVPIVIDPIFSASANHKMMLEKGDEESWKELYLNDLFPFSTLITPNKKELKILIGEDIFRKKDFTEMRKLLYAENLIITDGDSSQNIIEEYLCMPNEVLNYSHPKIKSKNLHGTGCVFSSLMASFLGLGFDLIEAFKFANKYIEKIINDSKGYILGESKYGPLNINNYTLI